MLPRPRARTRAWLLLSWLALPVVDVHAAPPEPVEVPDELVPPELLEPVTFTYPAALLERDPPPGGRISVQYVVGIDGVPKELELLESPDPELDALGLEVVGALRYRPATYQGEPVEVVLSIGFDVVPPTPEVEEPEPEVETDVETETDVEPEPESDQGPVRIRGRLREAGLRSAIEGASVIAIPAGNLPVGPIRTTLYEEPSEPAWTVEARSEAEGRFALRGVPEGKVRLIVIAPGYERTEQVVELKPGRELELNLWPRRLPSNPYQTVVTSDREPMPEVVERTLSVEEIKQVPGSQGDALKAIQNFPGVARAPFGSGLLAIRGAAPEDSAIIFGYHEIPILYHFGGIRSVFATEILAQVDFIPGNFDSRYGDAIGGVVNVQPRKGRRDGYHGFIDTNLFDTGVLVEGPVGKGSLILAGRRSYIDFLLPRVIPPDAGLNFTVAPRYWDYQAIFDYPVSEGELSIRAFGSDDRTKLVFSGANDDPDAVDEVRDSVETKQWFHRVDMVYRKQLGPWELLVTPAYRRSKTELSIFDVLDLDVVTDDVTARAELSQQIAAKLRWRIGTELTTTRFAIDVTAPQSTTGGSGPAASSAVSRSVTDTLFRGALYSTMTIGIGERVLLYPGVRFEWYAAPLERAALDPRLRMSARLTATTTLKAALGLYTQGIQQPVQFDSTFGNPRLGLQRSVHASLGVAQKLPGEVSLELTGFYKELWDLVVPSSDLVERPDGEVGPESFANRGSGHIYGSELLLRKNLTRSLFGWVSYTLSRSQRSLGPGEPQSLFDFDQTHILTIVGSYRMPRGWQFGVRFRLVSGNPRTPITDGVYDASSDGFLALQGPLNGARLPAFHQLDLRLDKTWTWPVLRFSVYVDVQNVYNRQNVEFLNFGYDFRTTATVNSLPILPALGLRAEF
ncbi:TonB-dependent receptor domain-containing protein [Nannocystaceae bacterium ST9]